jgi:hypothetical protein
MAKKKDISSENIDQSIDHLIREIREAFKKLKCQEMVDILSQWGKESTENTADLIMSWNTYYDNDVKDDGSVEDILDEIISGKGKKKKIPIIIPWIDILGRAFKINMLLSIEKDQSYDFLRNKYKYQIILNRSEGTVVFYTNTTFDFDTKEQQDREYESLKLRLEPFNIKFF